MAEVSSLRQAFNRVVIVGELEEKNFKISDGKDYQGNPVKQIFGTLVVSYGENKKIKVTVSANDTSKLYGGYVTVMNEYVSKAEALAKGLPAESVSYIKVDGKFKPYDGISKKDLTPYYLATVGATFINREERTTPMEATFSTEIYLEAIEPEVVDEKETGRAKVEGIIPLYGGAVMPITFYTITDESRGGNVGKYMLEHYEVGKTYSVQGEIDCIINHKEYVREGMFGSTTETFESVKTEFLLNEKSSPNAYLITDPKHYDKNTIKAAMLHRQEKIDSRVAKEREKTNGVSNSQEEATTMFSSPTTPPTNNFDDIVF